MRQMRHRPYGLICNIDVTAFAGVMFALVYLFMPLQPHGRPGATVDLARTNYTVSMRGADREDALLVAIMRDGKVFFRADRITIEEVPARIREGVSRGAERKVYIKADARAKYASVVEVLDGVHDAGIENIGFIVDQRRPLASNPQ
jgi:biopolymer transport protein TolR